MKRRLDLAVQSFGVLAVAVVAVPIGLACLALPVWVFYAHTFEAMLFTAGLLAGAAIVDQMKKLPEER